MEDEAGDPSMTRQELEVRQDDVAATQAVTLFRTDDPKEIVARATAVADTLSGVLKDKKLTTSISGREHVRVEGWTLCGTMLGVFPVCTWTRPIENGWEARVEARTLAGALVGAAEAECLRTESLWKSRDDYAIRSMAQTRATSKALRIPLGFIVSLAGFETTLAEEVERGPAGGEWTPHTHLLENAPHGWKEIGDRLAGIDPTVDWRSINQDVLMKLYGAHEVKALDKAAQKAVGIRAANTVRQLEIDIGFDKGSFPPPTDAQIKAAYAFAWDGTDVEVFYVEVAYDGPDGDPIVEYEQMAQEVGDVPTSTSD